MEKDDLSKLDKKLLTQATLGDLRQLLQSVIREDVFNDDTPKKLSGRKVYGIKGIAEELGISIPTAQRHVNSGKLDGAITRIGKVIVADSDALWAIFQCNKKLKYARQ